MGKRVAQTSGRIERVSQHHERTSPARRESSLKVFKNEHRCVRGVNHVTCTTKTGDEIYRSCAQGGMSSE